MIKFLTIDDEIRDITISVQLEQIKRVWTDPAEDFWIAYAILDNGTEELYRESFTSHKSQIERIKLLKREYGIDLS